MHHPSVIKTHQLLPIRRQETYNSCGFLGAYAARSWIGRGLRRAGTAPRREVEDPLPLGLSFRNAAAASLGHGRDGGLGRGTKTHEDGAGKQRRPPTASETMYTDSAPCLDFPGDGFDQRAGLLEGPRHPEIVGREVVKREARLFGDSSLPGETQPDGLLDLEHTHKNIETVSAQSLKLLSQAKGRIGPGDDCQPAAPKVANPIDRRQHSASS
jgi:hypothetical protein